MKRSVFPLIFSTGASVLCWRFAGNSLDLFLISFVLASLLSSQLEPGAVNAFAIGLPLSLMWMLPVQAHTIGIGAWCLCVLLLGTFLVAISQTARLLARFNPSMAVALTSTIVLMWLTFPVWASPYLAGSALHYSVLLHPLFAMNHVLLELGIWTEQQGAYTLTNLGQDAQYQLPYSAWPAIVFQLSIALIAMTLDRVREFYFAAELPGSQK